MDIPPDAQPPAGANTTFLQRLFRKVRPVDGGCWLWTASPNQHGYGRVRLGGTGSPEMLAHRAIYAVLRGPIPDGMQLHHTCGSRLCVNPDHVELLLPEEHRRRHPLKETCGEGHDLTDPANVYRWRGVRHCRICRRMSDRRRLGIPYDRWKVDR